MTPLIYTTKGNLPLADLNQFDVWSENPDETICATEYYLGEELVKREVHILKRTGLSTLSNLGGF